MDHTESRQDRDVIVAGTAHHVTIAVAHDGVISGAAPHDRRTPEAVVGGGAEVVIARSAAELSELAACLDDIISAAAPQHVLASVGTQDVGGAVAEDLVVVIVAFDVLN